MSVMWETATLVKNGVTYWLKDEKARTLLKECYSPSNPPPPSLPSGGTTGQVLKKKSNTDGDVEWADESGGATNAWYATCSTDAGVGAKTAVSATGDFSLATGSMVRVLFSKANIASNPTLSVDGSTAKNIRPVSTASGMDYMWKAGEVVDLVYDGSNFVMTKGGKADTSFYGITKLSNSTNSSATDVAATSKAVKDVKDAIPAASSATPQDLGAAAPGSSSDFSRADHVHQKPTYSKTDVGLGNVDNVQQYSASNPPPYPVRSVNGQTGDVVVQGSGIAISDTEPTGDELVWIDTDDPGTPHIIPEIDDDHVSASDTWSSQKIRDFIYPVGSIYMSVNSTSPATIFGGTWEQLENRFLLGAGSDYAAGTTGGEAEHTLTVDEIPSHSHKWPSKYSTSIGAYIWYTPWTNNSGTIDAQVRAHTDAAGGGEAHNNMPPYLAVYMWKRTA